MNQEEVCVSLYVKAVIMQMCLFVDRGDQEVRLPGVVFGEVEQVAVSFGVPLSPVKK